MCPAHQPRDQIDLKLNKVSTNVGDNPVIIGSKTPDRICPAIRNIYFYQIVGSCRPCKQKYYMVFHKQIPFSIIRGHNNNII